MLLVSQLDYVHINQGQAANSTSIVALISGTFEHNESF